MKPCFKRSRFYHFILLFSMAWMTGCRIEPKPEADPLPLSRRVTWMGNSATRFSDSLPGASDTAGLLAPVGLHNFEFPILDSARLLLKEYANAWAAYAVFQQSATPAEMAEGFYRERHALVFPHDRFVGILEYARAANASADFLKENLSFQGEELYAKPKEFSAFPLLGRIPHSERVIPSHFMGRNWQGPVFTIAYHCHSDTATAFRAWKQNQDSVKTWLADWRGKSDTLEWGREIHFQGWDEFRRPLIFWFFSDGIMGFSGCFDPVLAAEYDQKMEKTNVFWAKP